MEPKYHNGGEDKMRDFSDDGDPIGMFRFILVYILVLCVVVGLYFWVVG